MKKIFCVDRWMVFCMAGIFLLAPRTGRAADIVIENDHFSYVIGADGRNLHFIDKASGIDYLDKGAVSYCAHIRREGRQYDVSAVERKGNVLRCHFEGSDAALKVVWKKDVIEIKVLRVSPGAEALVFLDVPLTLKGMSDEPFGACILALNLFTHVRELPALQTRLWAACYTRFGMKGAQIALLGVRTGEMLPLIRDVISQAKDIPHSDAGGSWAQSNKEGFGSYLMNFGSLTAETVDKWIAMCRDIGFNQIDNHGGGFFNFGELKIDTKRFPGGWQDFKMINRRLNDSGISSIFHTYAFFIDKKSGFVTPVASKDLAYFRVFTLAGPLEPGDTVITVNEPTTDISTITGFFVRNSISLRLGDEIIEFSGVTSTPPYQFTGCRRGVWGTKVSVHGAGEKAYHLKELYGRFVPDPDSKLFTRIATRTAEIVDEAGFNGLYLDAIDGSDILGGADNFWYYGSRFIFEVARHLKHPVGMEMSSMSHAWWNYRMRWQAWDMPFRGYKRFVDIHLAAIKSPNIFLTDKIRSNDFEHGVWRGDTSYINRWAPLPNGSLMLPLSLGWWGNQLADPPQIETTYPDDVEYLCGKMIGNNAGVAVLGGFDKGTLTSIPLYGRLDSIIRVYEGLRNSGYFNDSVRALLREPGKEYHLFRQENGRWNFKPIVYEKHKVDGDGAWTVWNGFAGQPVRLRIEALMSAGGYEDTGSVVLADPSREGEFVKDTAAEGVDGNIRPVGGALASGGAAVGGSAGGVPALTSGAFVAGSVGREPARASWLKMEKRFDRSLDLGKKQALGVWVKGDSSGALLNLRLESPKHISHGARGDHFIRLDFNGWKYFTLVEIASSDFSNYSWPVSDFYVYDSYRHTIDFRNVDKLQLWYNNLPAGREVSCQISAIKALPLMPGSINRPSITIGGKKIVFPVTMRSGMYLEFNSMSDCKLYGSKGELIQEVQVEGDVPSLAGGVNGVVFSSEKSAETVLPRAQVTIIEEGKAL